MSYMWSMCELTILKSKDIWQSLYKDLHNQLVSLSKSSNMCVCWLMRVWVGAGDTLEETENGSVCPPIVVDTPIYYKKKGICINMWVKSLWWGRIIPSDLITKELQEIIFKVHLKIIEVKYSSQCFIEHRNAYDPENCWTFMWSTFQL